MCYIIVPDWVIGKDPHHEVDFSENDNGQEVVNAVLKGDSHLGESDYLVYPWWKINCKIKYLLSHRPSKYSLP